jgi:hypothetical protein
VSSQDVFVHVDEYKQPVALTLPRLKLRDEVYDE